MNDFYEGRMIPLKIADQAIINCNKEIEKLQIENDALKAEVERLTVFCNCTLVPNNELQAEVARLQAEVERLTKAGLGSVKYVDHTMALARQSTKHHAEVDRLLAELERLKAGEQPTEWRHYKDGDTAP